jgi:hypothetical protein
MKIVYVIFAILLLASPAAAQNVQLEINNDPYQASIAACAPERSELAVFAGEAKVRFCGLKSRTTPEIKTALLSLFQHNQRNWIDYDRGTKLGGEPVKIMSRKSVGSCRYGCTYYDTVGIVLTLPEVVDCAVNGFRVKLWGLESRELYVSPNECEAVRVWLESSPTQ